MDLSFSENAFYHICPRVEMNSHESAFGRKCFFLLSVLVRIEEILNVVSLYALYVTGFYCGKDRKNQKGKERKTEDGSCMKNNNRVTEVQNYVSPRSRDIFFLYL